MGVGERNGRVGDPGSTPDIVDGDLYSPVAASDVLLACLPLYHGDGEGESGTAGERRGRVVAVDVVDLLEVNVLTTARSSKLESAMLEMLPFRL